jgi:hypothetical protein
MIFLGFGFWFWFWFWFWFFGFLGFVSKKVAALFFWRAAEATRYFKNKAD